MIYTKKDVSFLKWQLTILLLRRVFWANIKGSASQLNKLVLKALIYRYSVVLIFFPGLVINTYTNFQKTLPRAVSATIRCI